MTISKNTPLKVKQQHRNLTGYWEGSFCYRVQNIDFQPGSFTFYGSLDDLLDLIDKCEDEGYFYGDVPTEDVELELINQGGDLNNLEGEDTWDVEFRGEERPRYFEEFELTKMMDEYLN